MENWQVYHKLTIITDKFTFYNVWKIDKFHGSISFKIRGNLDSSISSSTLNAFVSCKLIANFPPLKEVKHLFYVKDLK